MRTNYLYHLRIFDYIGLHRYFLTWCTDARVHHFTKSDRVEIVRDQILRAAREETFAVFVYCFMPDHLHLLMEARSDSSDLRRFIRRAKQYSGYAFSQAFGRRLWQRYGYEHVLRDDEKTFVVARYILENPLRANLAKNVEDYPFIGSELFTIREMVEGSSG